MEEALADKPDVFVKVLEIMSEFENDISQSPPALFKKLSKILEPWPELIQGFAPFLMPEQAHKCGLVSHVVDERVRISESNVFAAVARDR